MKLWPVLHCTAWLLHYKLLSCTVYIIVSLWSCDKYCTVLPGPSITSYYHCLYNSFPVKLWQVLHCTAWPLHYKLLSLSIYIIVSLWSCDQYYTVLPGPSITSYYHCLYNSFPVKLWQVLHCTAWPLHYKLLSLSIIIVSLWSCDKYCTVLPGPSITSYYHCLYNSFPVKLWQVYCTVLPGPSITSYYHCLYNSFPVKLWQVLHCTAWPLLYKLLIQHSTTSWY